MKKEEKVLLKEAQGGNNSSMEELVTDYKPLVSTIVRRYFIVGGEQDDLIQEGMIGLYQAIQTYDFNSEASFKTFATLCINRKVQNAVKSANRQKNKMLNQFVAINNQGIIVMDSSNNNEDENEESEAGIYIESNAPDPEDVAISRERQAYIKTQIEKKLTILEKNILQLYIEGKTYAQIASELNITKKLVDNNLFKIRKKLAFLKNE
ncbi:MAG: sigma-70 family RNA polymerase sigma factor [Spirochaetales bacterium]